MKHHPPSIFLAPIAQLPDTESGIRNLDKLRPARKRFDAGRLIAIGMIVGALIATFLFLISHQ